MSHAPSGAPLLAPADYRAALDYLFARTTGAFKFGLERTSRLLTELGEPHRVFPSIHVAGTNGKGSSVAVAEALLRAKKLRVGKYTSPHLVDFRERIVVDGRCIEPEQVVEFVREWTPTIETIGASFFEATTAMAFAYFASAGVDVALVETGLGGRLDATNVIDPVAAGVTTIGYDHTEYLGDTLPQIAAEKAGIFKRGRAAVIGESDVELRRVLSNHARAAGASSIRVVAEEWEIADVAVDAAGTRFSLRRPGLEQEMRTPLAGVHQASNVAFALTLLEAAGPPYACSPAAASLTLAHVQVPGRFQRVGRHIFDVAHNAEGASVLAETLAAIRPSAPVTALFSVLADKDWREMMRQLAPHVTRFVLTTAPSAPANRVWSVEAAREFADHEGVSAEVVQDFDLALERASSFGATTLVTGSFHTVGDAMARLQLSPYCG